MIPTRLQLRGFLSYREPVDLDLSTVEVACLAGDNGSGKSALLDAITWALWGKARGSDRDIISLGEQEMEVTFCFLLSGQEYRVMRRRSYPNATGSGRHTLDVMVRAHGEGEDDWREAGGDSVGNTQRRIDGLLNLDYATFVRSVFVMQGQADLFMQETPAKRKELLAEILNLQEYDALKTATDRQLRELRSTLDQRRGRETTLLQQLERRPQLERDLDAAAAQLQQVGAQADAARLLQQQLAEQVQTWRAARDLLQSLQRREADDRQALERIAGDLRQRQAERADLNAVLERAEQIRTGVAALAAAREEAQRQAQLARRNSEFTAERTRLARIVDDAQRALERERDDQRHQQSRLAERLEQAERDVREHETVSAEIARLSGLLAAYPDLDVLERETQGRLDQAQTHLGGLKHQAADCTENLKRVQEGDERCPVCRAPMSEQERDRIVEAWNADLARLRRQYRDGQQLVKEIEAERAALRGQRQERDQQAHSLRTAQQRVEQLAPAQALVTDLQGRSETCARMLRLLERRIAEQDDAPDERFALTHVTREQEALGYSMAAHDAADDAVRRLQVHDEEQRALERAETALTGVAAAIGMLEGQQRERETSLADLQQQIARVAPAMEQGLDLDARLRQALDEVERLDRERTRCDQQFGAVERELTTLDGFDSELRAVQKELDRLQVDESALKELSTAFGRNGIQAMIIDTILPELADETNELLGRFAGSNLRVSFRSQKELVSREGMSETLEIVVRDEAGERDLRLFSGGEAFRVNFAIRVALSRLLAKRAGASIELLVIDEGFGTQDSAGREGLIEALNSVRADFRTILVITHIHELRELFPTRIEVVKTEAGSQVAVVH